MCAIGQGWYADPKSEQGRALLLGTERPFQLFTVGVSTMSYRSQSCSAVRPALALALAVSLAAVPFASALAGPPGAGKSSSEGARLATYEKPSGERYFALALAPKLSV